MAVQIDESGQNGQPPGVEHDFVFPGQSLQALTDGRDLSVPDIDLNGPALCVDSVYKQHGKTLPVFGVRSNGQKKELFLKGKSSDHEKRKHRTHRKNGCKLLFQICVHFGQHSGVSFFRVFYFRYILS